MPKKNADAMREAIDALNEEISEFKIEKKKKKKKRKAEEMPMNAKIENSPKKKRKKTDDFKEVKINFSCILYTENTLPSSKGNFL